MNNSTQVDNSIFRDAIIGVLLLVAAAISLIMGFLLVHPPVGLMAIIDPLLAAGGIYFLHSAFNKDKYKPQVV